MSLSFCFELEIEINRFWLVLEQVAEVVVASYFIPTASPFPVVFTQMEKMVTTSVQAPAEVQLSFNPIQLQLIVFILSTPHF
jgi:hypothetical protein